LYFKNAEYVSIDELVITFILANLAAVPIVPVIIPILLILDGLTTLDELPTAHPEAIH
jgi:hypothetical protein